MNKRNGVTAEFRHAKTLAEAARSFYGNNHGISKTEKNVSNKRQNVQQGAVCWADASCQPIAPSVVLLPFLFPSASLRQCDEDT